MDGLKWCLECGMSFKPAGSQKVCSEECRTARKKVNSASIPARHQALLRILDREKVWKDPLRDIEIYESVIAKGCHYCKASLLESSGICLDRILDGKHTFELTVPCCKTCNRLKSSGPGIHDGFSVLEMQEVIGPAVAQVRNRRSLKK